MKSKIGVLAPVMLLAACATTTSPEPTYEWIDLTQTDVPYAEYWVAERKVQPRYSERGARNRYAGCVEMAFLISPEGRAEHIEVVRSFPNKVFDATGVEALQEWRWAPSESNSARQAVKTTVKFDYTVEGVRNLEAVQDACDGDLRQVFG
ncbi:MAG: energy transducer TonB [Idiomarina sp.]|nr:energy transducer TonB [Idiomarina sp.]